VTRGRIVPQEGLKWDERRRAAPDILVEKPRLVTPREGAFLAVIKNDNAVSVKPGPDLLYAVDINDLRSVNAHELLGIQTGLKTRYGFADQVRGIGRVDPYIVAFRRDPGDLACRNEEQPFTVTDDQPLKIRRRGLDVIEKPGKPVPVPILAADLIHGALQSALEAVFANRF